jgi:hypothetical protein
LAASKNHDTPPVFSINLTLYVLNEVEFIHGYCA